MQLYIDADACPVKEETYKVAARYHMAVTLVANAPMRIPQSRRIRLQVVGKEADAADDWIVSHVEADDIVVTADIPLAGRCLEKRARVIGTTGRWFTADNIGDALATRELMSDLREAGEFTGGPRPISRRDRSTFLQKLDELVNAPQIESEWDI
jgi:uncharacterized protein YaiI (UPF0178 family)